MAGRIVTGRSGGRTVNPVQRVVLRTSSTGEASITAVGGVACKLDRVVPAWQRVGSGHEHVVSSFSAVVTEGVGPLLGDAVRTAGP